MNPSPRIVYELAAAVAEESGARLKTCPACGAGFACLPGACWCAALKLSPQTLRDLRAKYDNCLCPACLLPLAQ